MIIPIEDAVRNGQSDIALRKRKLTIGGGPLLIDRTIYQ
jgi:hypothetical protein